MIKKFDLINKIFLMGFIVGCNRCYQSENGQNMLIESARKFLVQNGHNVRRHIGYIEDTQDWQKVYAELETSGDTKFLDRFKVLENKAFQVIVFKPREPNTLGGVYRVFISDGNILTYYGEK
jgi:hypothetical protein